MSKLGRSIRVIGTSSVAYLKKKEKIERKKRGEKKKPYTLPWVYSVSVLPSQLHTDSWIPQNMCRGGNGSQSRYCLPKQSFRIPFFRTGMRSEISWFRSQYSQECLDSERHVERQETTEAEWQTCWWNKKGHRWKRNKSHKGREFSHSLPELR